MIAAQAVADRLAIPINKRSIAVVRTGLDISHCQKTSGILRP